MIKSDILSDCLMLFVIRSHVFKSILKDIKVCFELGLFICKSLYFITLLLEFRIISSNCFYILK